MKTITLLLLLFLAAFVLSLKRQAQTSDNIDIFTVEGSTNFTDFTN